MEVCFNPFFAGAGRKRLLRGAAAAVAACLKNFGHCPTPLRRLDALAKRLGLGRIYVKDESRFLNLNAFKGRGVLWACAKIIAEKTGLAVANLDKLKAAAAGAHFVSATDGNHGAALACAAAIFGVKATIFMPKGASMARVAAIEKQGATCVQTDLVYDDAVRHAAAFADSNGAILAQDTAWRGYEKIPAWIMQGYAAMAPEILDQLECEMPTHVFLQVGVGSFAAAFASGIIEEARTANLPAPKIVCMEPENAACFYRSLAVGDGAAHAAPGDLNTLMAGLACGELSSLAWPILRDNAFAAITCPDSLAALGMRLLARPAGDDPFIISGESGAIGAGLLVHLMAEKPALAARLGLKADSRVLLVSTEGATDPALWQEITGLACV